MATSAVMNPSSPSKSDAARSPSLWDPSLLPELPELPPFDSAIMEDLMRITEEDNVGVGQPMAGGETFAGTVTSQVSETPAELRSEINTPMNAESFGGVSSMDYGSTSSNLGDSDLRVMINEILQMDVGIDWGHFPADTSAAEQFEQRVYQSPLTIGNPMVGSGNIALEGGPGRGAKRSPPIANLEESAASKKQMRKIKNREQAALSRERVKAYVASLESRVARLKKENAALKMEKRIMLENPVKPKKKLLEKLRGCRSTEW